MFLILVLGWLLPRVSPWMWTRFILTMIAIPALHAVSGQGSIRAWEASRNAAISARLLSDLTLGLIADVA